MSEKKQPLHWPGWVWVIGHFLLGAFVVYSLIKGFSLLPGGISLDDIIQRYVYFPIFIASAIAMLLHRKTGWYLALVTLFVSTVSVLWAGLRELLASPMCIAYLLMFIVPLGVVAINVVWTVYFILARRKYGISPHRSTA